MLTDQQTPPFLHGPGAFPYVYKENIVTCEAGFIHGFDTFWGKTLKNPVRSKQSQDKG